MTAPPIPRPAPPKPLWAIESDGKIHYSLHRGQRDAWNSNARFTFVIAGSQAGKTSFGPLWLHREIQARGPGDYLAVTATYPLMKLKMWPEFMRLFDETLHLGAWNGTDHVYQFKNDETRVIFGSATHPNSLESATAKGAWLDECGQDEFRQESWMAVQRRLALSQGRVLGTTTPYNLGWLKQQVYDRWRRGEPDYVVINFPSTTNPAFPQEEYDRLRLEMQGWRFDMMHGGLFAKPAGIIYGDYVDDYRESGGHLVHPFQILPHWSRYGGVDPGGINLARLIAAEDPDAHVFYLYDESLAGGLTTAEHATRAKDAVAGTNMRTWHGGSASEGQVRRDWAAAGVPLLEPLVSDVEQGIDRVISLFKTHRLYVFDTLTGLRDELGSYSRPVDANGEPMEGIKDKSTYHRLDALRYLAQALIGSGQKVEFY